MFCMLCGERLAEICLDDLETHVCMECYERVGGSL